MMRKQIAIVIILIATLLSTGCSKKQIFINKEEIYTVKEVADKEMEDDVFYVKDGSGFGPVYKASGTASGTASNDDPTRILWLDKDQRRIPVYFDGQLIAYQSEQTSLEQIQIERFRDMGYSIGIYGAKLDEDGFLALSTKDNTIPGSDANKILNKMKSDSIRIVSINGKPLEPDNVSTGGFITGLDKSKSYEIGLYSGTQFGTVEIKADRKILQSYECYQIEKAKLTKKGYLSIELPENAKSGYYMVNGAGLFIYYDFKKGEKQVAKQEMNTAYYTSEKDKLAVYAQQFIAAVPTETHNVMFHIKYATDVYNDKDIVCLLTSPEGTNYQMTASQGVASVNLDSAMAGNWCISITPRDLQVTDITTESSAASASTIKDKYQYTFKKNKRNLRFFATYKGEGDIWATIEDENGNTHDMELDSANKTLSYTYAYLEKGTYKITVYHYNDVSILDTGHGQNEDNEMQDVITIED